MALAETTTVTSASTKTMQPMMKIAMRPSSGCCAARARRLLSQGCVGCGIGPVMTLSPRNGNEHGVAGRDVDADALFPADEPRDSGDWHAGVDRHHHASSRA